MYRTSHLSDKADTELVVIHAIDNHTTIPIVARTSTDFSPTLDPALGRACPMFAVPDGPIDGYYPSGNLLLSVPSCHTHNKLRISLPASCRSKNHF